MPLGSIKLRPGVNVEMTPTLNEAGISSANLVRFKDGMVQKLGGWAKYYAFTIGSYIRDLHGWQDLNENLDLAVGAEASLSVITNGVNVDITPRERIVDLTPDFETSSGDPEVIVNDVGSAATIYDYVFIATQVSIGGIILFGLYPVTTALGADEYEITAADDATATETGGLVPEYDTTSGSATVTVTLPDHGLVVGDDFEALVSTDVGGLTIFGTYEVISAPTADTFTIIASSVATSTDNEFMNGGDARLVYYIAVGPAAAGSGYGVGGYGEGGYGTGVAPTSNPGDPIVATGWEMDNWGEILVANPRGGGIYFWQPNRQFSTASLIPNAPLFNNGIFIAMPQRILVAWGSTPDNLQQDPLLLRWSGAGDFTVWTASSSNQAGSFRIPTGSKIVAGLQGPNSALIWTDIDLWVMNYIQPPLVFGFSKLGTGCGLVGPKAAGILNSAVYWMNLGGFQMLSGSGIKDIPCSVWDAVYQDLDQDNLDKIVCAPNSMFDEVAWYYPTISDGTGEPVAYVKLNTIEGSWDLGVLQRTAWIDQSVLGEPIGAYGSTGIIYQHEVSNNADGGAMQSWFETGDFMIRDGNEIAFIDWLIPDFKYGFYNGAQIADIAVTIKTQEYPGSSQVVKGPFSFNVNSQQLTVRSRGRQARVRMESSDLDSFWRIGNVRYRWAPDGRR